MIELTPTREPRSTLNPSFAFNSPALNTPPSGYAPGPRILISLPVVSSFDITSSYAAPGYHISSGRTKRPCRSASVAQPERESSAWTCAPASFTRPSIAMSLGWCPCQFATFISALTIVLLSVCRMLRLQGIPGKNVTSARIDKHRTRSDRRFERDRMNWFLPYLIVDGNLKR